MRAHGEPVGSRLGGTRHSDHPLCRSTAYHFNPKPASPRFLSHSLVELLNQISPTFKKNFAALQKKR